ncbi:MAG: DUF3305 domain-containing protein [Acetobacteraceae bacterium]|nr:DUF3305 domain-containing protein [Acetobacteraceae bacterium]
MAALLVEVGVVGELVQPVTAWGVARWCPRAVLAEVPATAPRTQLPGGLVYLGPAQLVLHHVETGNYRDNLATGAPRLWVVLDQDGMVVALSADPTEGESFSEAGVDAAARVVEMVPMPAPIAARLAAFVAEHHVERTFHKRQRDRADPDSLGRRSRVDEE